MNGSDSCSMSSVVVDKHVYNQSRKLKPKTQKHPDPDEYLEYLNINSRDYDGKTQTTYSEHREYIKISHNKDQVKGVEKTNAAKHVNVPAGSKMFGGFIIPPFFSLSRNDTKAENDQPESSGNFISRMFNKLIASPSNVNEGEVDAVIGQRLSIWEERKKAGTFLDNYLRDCVSKESSVFSPEEKVEMKRIQDILIREKEEEREREREENEKKEKQQERIERKKKKIIEKKVEDSLRRKKSRDDEERETTLGTVLSGEHPLFARKFREKVRIFTKSGTEVNVDKNGVSAVGDRSSGDHLSVITDGTIDLVQAIREENKKTRQIMKRVYSSEADWCSSTIEPNHPNSHQIDLTGDVEVEFSHKVMEENHEILHKLQVDQAKDIRLNKIIIEENKRTLKKLKMEQEKEKQRLSVNNDNFKIKKMPSGRFLKKQKKLSRNKSKCSNIETSVRSNTNLENDSRENKTTNRSEEIVRRQSKKKAWSNEMLSKKEKAQPKRKGGCKVLNFDGIKDYNNGHSSDNTGAAVIIKPNQLKELSLETEHYARVIPNIEEESNFDDMKVISYNKRVNKLDKKQKSPQADKCISGCNSGREKWEGSLKSDFDEGQCEIQYHGQLSLVQGKQTFEEFLMEENQNNTFDNGNCSRDNTEYGPSSIESMIRDMKDAGLTRSIVPIKRKPLDDFSLYDQHEYCSDENVSTYDIRTHAINDEEELYLLKKRNAGLKHTFCEEDAIGQSIKSPYSSAKEGEMSYCENRHFMLKTHKRRITKKLKPSGRRVETTTSKDSMAKSIQLRDEAIQERRKYISNRRKKVHGSEHRYPAESIKQLSAGKIAQEACLQTYQEVQNKLRLLGKVLKEGEMVKRSKKGKQKERSFMAKFQGAIKNKFCKQRLPKDQILKFGSEKDLVCVPSVTRSKRVGLVVSKRKMGFNCISSHKGNHVRKHDIHNSGYNPSHQVKSLCIAPGVLDNLQKSEDRRRRKLKEMKGKEDERKLMERTKMERKSKLTELLHKVNRKTATYSLLSHLIEQNQYYSDSSEDDLVPDIRQGKEKEAKDSKCMLVLIDKPKESTSDERVIAAKRRRTSFKLNDRRSRQMDLERNVIFKRKSSKQINTEDHQQTESCDVVELHKDIPHLESETKVYHGRESSYERKTKTKHRSCPKEKISDKNLIDLEKETKEVHKRESSHQYQQYLRNNKNKNRASPDEGISDRDLNNMEQVTKVQFERESSNERKTKKKNRSCPDEEISDKDLTYLETETKLVHERERSHKYQRKNKNKNRASPNEGMSDKGLINLDPETKLVHKKESSHERKTKGQKLVAPLDAVYSHNAPAHLEAETKIHKKVEKSNKRKSKRHKRVASLDEKECDKYHLKSNTSHHEVNVTQDESKKQQGMKGNRARRGHGSDASHQRDGRRSKRRESSKRNGEHKDQTHDIDKILSQSYRLKGQKELSGLQNQISNEEGIESGKYTSKNTRDKKHETSKLRTDIISERDAQKDSFGAETNAEQKDTISIIPNYARSKKMVEHMSNVLSEYLAMNRQNKQTEEVYGGKIKRERKGDEELSEAVENIWRSKQSDHENDEWKKAKETLETGKVTKRRKNREHLLKSCSSNHKIISKHVEECVEKINNDLSATKKHKEPCDRLVNNADVQHKSSEINIKSDQGDGIFHPVVARHPASGKTGNVCPSGSAEDYKKVVSLSNKRVKVLEPKSDDSIQSKSSKSNNKDILPGGSSKKRERDPNGHSIREVGTGYGTKKASLSTEDKMSGHIVLNNEEFDKAAGDVLKKNERSDKSNKFLNEEDHIPTQNITGVTEKCLVCMNPDITVKSQCAALVHSEVVSQRCECITTSQLIEMPNRLEDGKRSFESIGYPHGNSESKCEGKPICDTSSDDNIIDCRKNATSCHSETVNVISCLDTPDGAIREIFKKMDDVIINRFLTLASNNGITIVVTPKLVVNETTQETSESNYDGKEHKPEVFSEGGFEANVHNTNKVMEKINEESMTGTEDSDTNENVAHNIVAVNDKMTELHKNEQECIKGHQSKDSDIIELKSGINDKGDKGFVNNVESVISNQESHVKAASKPPHKKKSVPRQYKNNLYFITQTFSKTPDAKRRDKKFRVRLPRNKTMLTGSKVRKMTDWYQSEQERTKQQVIEGQKVVDTTSPDYNGLEDNRKGKNHYDHCNEQALHCLPSPKQVEGKADREKKKQSHVPVDQFLEKVRNDLNEEEMELLDAASRSTINVLSERRQFQKSDESLDLLFCKHNYTNVSSASSMVPDIRTIEEVIAEADSNDSLLSICECFGVDTIDDLMDHLKSIGSNEAVEQMEAIHGKKKCYKKQPQNYWHKKMKNDKEIDAKGRHRERTSRNGVEMIDDYSKNRSKDIYNDPWYCSANGELPKPKERFDFSNVWHCKDTKIKCINKWNRTSELEKRESARQEKTGVIPIPNKKKGQIDEHYELSLKDINVDASFSLSNFIHNYALKSGIILADTSSTTLAKGSTSGDHDTDDVLSVKIQLNDKGSNKKTSIVIKVPETQDFVLAKRMYKGIPSLTQAPPSPLTSSAQIVHIDSEEIVLSTDLPEEPEWTKEQEEAFEEVLKKHPPTPNVWDRIAKSVGRSKKDCVLHFMSIWRRLETKSV